MNTNALLQFFSGKKTYLTIAATFVVLFGVWQSWWKVPNEVYVALLAAAVAFLRNGIPGGPPLPPAAPAADPKPEPPVAPPGPPAATLFLFSWLRPFAAAWAWLWILVFMLELGCASIQSGADPIVVNVERTETMGQSAFDLILHVDDSNRAYFATNAPPFHDFCQWLRQPITIELTNTQPRAVALVLGLDDLKLDYQAGRASSNALLTACTTLQGLISQAQAWSSLTISTNH